MSESPMDTSDVDCEAGSVEPASSKLKRVASVQQQLRRVRSVHQAADATLTS